METTILGNCETSYKISKLPAHLALEVEEEEMSEDNLCEGRDYYEILKSKDLDNCKERPVYHKSYGVLSKSDGSGSDSFPSQSSVTRTIICGSLQDHYIRKSTTENRILVDESRRFESEQKIDISSWSVLELESVERAQKEISKPSSPKNYPSLVHEYPSASFSSNKSLKQQGQIQNQQNQQQQQQGQQQQQQQQQTPRHAPLPDLTSAPASFRPRFVSQNELKKKAVETFSKLIETSIKITDSSTTKKDVAGMSVRATKIISQLSYEELKEVEQTIRSLSFRDIKGSTVEKAFFDVVSMAGTNPCVMLVKDKIISGKVNEDPASWSWILSNTLRNVRTPTEELLKELIELMKYENVQQDRDIRAAYLMSLTELVHKACIDHNSMKNQFPYQIYGKMCSKEMPIIKNNLVPYLAKRLQESSSDLNTMLTYINALGNLGIKESSEELLKVVEGEISKSSLPRSLAVYLLIKPARQNPHLYRPIFLSLIENVAENTEVRMAGITALSNCYPSSANLQRLAIRTWFEPSRQVSSFIYSTLQSLSQLTDSVPEYETLRMKAKMILPMAKPSFEGYQYSHNLQYTQFIEDLEAAVSHKLQWISSEDSLFPKTIYAKAENKGVYGGLEALEATLQMQGVEYAIEKLYGMYSTMAGKNTSPGASFDQEIMEKLKQLGLTGKAIEKPEAHLTLKFFGLQKLYSFDDELMNEIVRKVSWDMMEYAVHLDQGVKSDYIKILDLEGCDITLPTDSGIPVYISVKNPTVAYSHTELKINREATSEPNMEINMKGVTNYKRQVHAGVISSTTKKFYGVGVENSVHISLPLNAEVSYSQGQVHIALKQSEEPEYQREYALLEFDVHPFTTAHDLTMFEPWGKGSEVKTIETSQSEQKKKVELGKPFGVDFEIRYSSEESDFYLYKLWTDLQNNVPMFLSSLPNPITSYRRTNIQLIHEPQNSAVKELDVYVTVGVDPEDEEQLQNQSQQQDDDEEERICSHYSSHSTQQCVSQLKQQKTQHDADIISVCQEEQNTRQEQQQHQQKLQQQQQQQQKTVEQIQKQWQTNQPGLRKQLQHQQQGQIQQHQQQDQKQQQRQNQQGQDQLEECKSGRQLCKEEKKLCMEKKEKDGLKKDEADRHCQKKYELCIHRHQSQQQLQKVGDSRGDSSAMSISVGAILRGDRESEDRKVEAHVSIGQRKEENEDENLKTSLKMTIQTPTLRKPFNVLIDTESDLKRPSQKWNRDEILDGDQTSKIVIQGTYGFKDEDKNTIGASIIAVQSDDQKNFVRQSKDYERCTRDESQGRKLTKNCKKTRHQAASLDMVHAQLSLPKEIADNRMVQLTSEAAKFMFLPYLSAGSIDSRESRDHKDYEVMAKVDGKGDTLSFRISGNGEEVSFDDIRLGDTFDGLLPICTRESLLTKVMQKLSSYSTPSSCVMEADKVQTFDKLEYSYELNDCEHVVFTESSSKPRVVVTTKRDQVKQEIRMFIDGHKYEVEINKESRFARGGSSGLKVDGETKEFQISEQYGSSQQGHGIYEEEDTQVTRYNDGVVSLYSRKYGVEVITDDTRLEVKSHQHLLRNRATGLCGDLNGEWTSDLKSPKQCVLSEPKLVALSFMLQDQKCRGVPQEESSKLQREEERCVKDEEVLTQVSSLFKRHTESKPMPEKKHISEEIRDGKICFSVQQIRVCSRGYPKEVAAKKVGFACVHGPKSEIMRRRAEAGDLLEELRMRPVQYTETIYEPSRC